MNFYFIFLKNIGLFSKSPLFILNGYSSCKENPGARKHANLACEWYSKTCTKWLRNEEQKIFGTFHEKFKTNTRYSGLLYRVKSKTATREYFCFWSLALDHQMSADPRYTENLFVNILLTIGLNLSLTRKWIFNTF